LKKEKNKRTKVKKTKEKERKKFPFVGGFFLCSNLFCVRFFLWIAGSPGGLPERGFVPPDVNEISFLE